MSVGSLGGEGVTAVGDARTKSIRVFINYRRGDSSGYAGRLYDSLTGRADGWNVFMDIDTIEPGVDFTEVIDKELRDCDVVIVMIGRQWLDAADGKGRRRLDDPDDFVRMEIEAALDRDIRVIPALVQGAEMPGSDALPGGLSRLARRNALELSDGRWRYDVDRLVQLLERVEQQRVDQQTAARAEQAERERLEHEEAERLQHEEAERLERERVEREHAEREARERAEVEARQAAEAEKQARKVEKQAREAERRAHEAEKRRLAKEAEKAAKASATRPARGGFSKRKQVIIIAVAVAVVGAGAAVGVIATGSSKSSSPPANSPSPSSPKPQVKIAAYHASPATPVAGEQFGIQLSLVDPATGKPVPRATTSCQARAGGRTLTGAPSVLSGGRFLCAWKVPNTAAGLVLAGTMRLAHGSASASHPFRLRIAPPPATLSFSGTPHVVPAQPSAGHEVRATLNAAWVRKGKAVRSLDPKSSAVSCRATIAGSPLKVTKATVGRRSVTCGWLVPSGAGGKHVVMTATVRSEGATARRTSTVRVRPVPAQSTPSPSPAPSPSPTTAPKASTPPTTSTKSTNPVPPPVIPP
jgi:hypothetical protein